MSKNSLKVLPVAESVTSIKINPLANCGNFYTNTLHAVGVARHVLMGKIILKK